MSYGCGKKPAALDCTCCAVASSGSAATVDDAGSESVAESAPPPRSPSSILFQARTELRSCTTSLRETPRHAPRHRRRRPERPENGNFGGGSCGIRISQCFSVCGQRHGARAPERADVRHTIRTGERRTDLDLVGPSVTSVMRGFIFRIHGRGSVQHNTS